MKVAVSTSGTTLDAKVDERFGRAARFLVVSVDDGEVREILDNTANQQAMQGAGIAAAELVAGSGVEAVITGNLGPKAFSALSAAGIPGWGGSGLTVEEAVRRFGEGKLEPLSEGAAHQGM